MPFLKKCIGLFRQLFSEIFQRNPPLVSVEYVGCYHCRKRRPKDNFRTDPEGHTKPFEFIAEVTVLHFLANVVLGRREQICYLTICKLCEMVQPELAEVIVQGVVREYIWIDKKGEKYKCAKIPEDPVPLKIK